MRNMIEVNQKAFSNLIQHLVLRSDLVVGEGKRYISTKEEEKDWIRTATEIDRLYITPNLRLVQLEFKTGIYVAIIGATLDSSVFDSSLLEEIELNSGLITLLLSLGYISLDKSVNSLEFYNNIIFQHVDEHYKGHDYLELLPYLEHIQLFFIPEYSSLKTQILSRIACYVFSKNSSQLVLDFKKDVIANISELSIIGSDNISYNVLLGCIFSNTYKHAFLELYRLIERLFSISYIREFHSKSGTKLSFLEFSSALETNLKWKPKEDDAIAQIFLSSNVSTKKYFEDFLKSSDAFRDQNDSKLFYSLRNSIVHFRPSHEDLQLDRRQWNLLLLATVNLIRDQYAQHDILLTK